MKKPAVFLAGVGTCALAVAGCSPASTSTPEPQSNPGSDSAQSAPGAPALSTIDPDTALTSKNGQGGPSAQSDQDADTVVVIVQLAEGADGGTTLASINEAVAAAFPGASVSVEREYRNALRGYALRVPAGSIDVIRSVSGVQAAYPDGNNTLQ
ncbi:Uncharacterised protein [Mycobacteroides abscessus subsp. abscessus]|nr:Uncharacterised protein [Mycobacteroides abscessus subsp. abscessus]